MSTVPDVRTVFVSYYFVAENPPSRAQRPEGFGNSVFKIQGKIDTDLILSFREVIAEEERDKEVVIIGWQVLED